MSLHAQAKLSDLRQRGGELQAVSDERLRLRTRFGRVEMWRWLMGRGESAWYELETGG